MIEKQPLISVIIPVYNVEKYISNCLDSVCGQTYKNLEIILVDDGSKDKSGEICEEYARKDARIKVFHKSNGGVSSARNLGLDKAHGEYIGFVDADDEIHSEMYQVLFAQLQRANADIAACRFECIKFGEEVIFRSTNGTPHIYESPESMLMCLPKILDFGMGCLNKLFRYEIIQSLRFNTNLICAEDLEFLIKLSDRVKRIVLIPQALYGYYQYPNSSYHAPRLSRVINECEVMKFFISFCRKRHYEQAIKEANRLLMAHTAFCAFILCVADISNKQLPLLKEQLMYLKDNKSLIKKLRNRKQRVFATCLAYFPKSTIFIVRLPFVRYLFNKKYHFDAYEL